MQSIQSKIQSATSTIPKFKHDGFLPPGEYTASWAEFNRRFGFNAARRRLLRHFHDFLLELRERGIPEVIIGGSLITCKQLPNDIDFAFDPSATERSRLVGLKAPSIKVGRRVIDPFQFVPEFVPMKDGETFSAREFFSFHNPTAQRVGIVVINMTDPSL